MNALNSRCWCLTSGLPLKHTTLFSIKVKRGAFQLFRETNMIKFLKKTVKNKILSFHGRSTLKLY